MLAANQISGRLWSFQTLRDAATIKKALSRSAIDLLGAGLYRLATPR
jgi:hypothetical protein